MITVLPCSVASDFEQVRDRGGVRRIEVAGRLVGKNQRRIVRQRKGDADALLLAAAQLLRTLLPLGFEPDQREQLRARGRGTRHPASRP